MIIVILLVATMSERGLNSVMMVTLETEMDVHRYASLKLIGDASL